MITLNLTSEQIGQILDALDDSGKTYKELLESTKCDGEKKYYELVLNRQKILHEKLTEIWENSEVEDMTGNYYNTADYQ